MKKVQCSNIEKGENVHTHYCDLCDGKQHVNFLKYLKYQINGLCVIMPKEEFLYMVDYYIKYYRKLHDIKQTFEYDMVESNENLTILHGIVRTLRVEK